MNEKPIDLVSLSARLGALEALVAELSRIGTHGASDRSARLQEMERWTERVRDLPDDSGADPFVFAWRASVESLISLVRKSLLRD